MAGGDFFMGGHKDDVHSASMAGLFAFAAAGAPLWVTVACTSAWTRLGVDVYLFLQGRSYSSWFMVASCVSLAIFFLDMPRWTGAAFALSGLAYAAAAACLLVGCVLYAGTAPSVLVVLGMALTLLLVLALRRLAMPALPTMTFMRGTSAAFVVHAALLASLWIAWAFTPALGGYNRWNSDMCYSERGERCMSLATRFVLWCSPLIASLACLLISLFAALRGRIHAADGAAAAEGESSGDAAFLDAEVKMVLACLALLVFSAWVALSLAGEGQGLSRTVLRLSSAMGVFIVAYLSLAIGLKRLWTAAKDIKSVKVLMDFVASDWAKGIFLTFAWPMLPMYFAVESLHQQVRRGLQAIGVVERDGYAGRCMTSEAAWLWGDMRQWGRASVLTKSIWFGILYFSLQVAVSQGITLFLVWIGEAIKAWPLWAVAAVLFAIGMVMFLLPPVPGLPIYIMSGIVIVQRCEQLGLSFPLSCMLAVLFSLFLKLAGVVMQQKGIGAPFAGSVAVKKAVAIHTPPMKAIKHILSQDGLTTAKVAVLCGGPDWPTSVLTGILDLRVSQMLLGTLPVVLLVCPVVLSGAFNLKSAKLTAESSDEDALARARWYTSLSSVMMMLSSVVLVGLMLTAGYFIEEVLQQFKREIEQGDWEADPQEAEVLESMERDEAVAKRNEQISRWPNVPLSLKAALYIGSMLSSLVIHMALSPFFEPFEEFSITARIADLPGGTALGLIHRSGWVAIVCCFAATVCLAAFYGWRGRQARELGQAGEADPLVPHKALSFRPAPAAGALAAA